MEVFDQIVSEKPSWHDKKSDEDVLKNEIEDLSTRIDELKSENAILKNQIEKLLQKPCCR